MPKNPNEKSKGEVEEMTAAKLLSSLHSPPKWAMELLMALTEEVHNAPKAQKRKPPPGLDPKPTEKSVKAAMQELMDFSRWGIEPPKNPLDPDLVGSYKTVLLRPYLRRLKHVLHRAAADELPKMFAEFTRNEETNWAIVLAQLNPNQIYGLPITLLSAELCKIDRALRGQPLTQAERAEILKRYLVEIGVFDESEFGYRRKHQNLRNGR